MRRGLIAIVVATAAFAACGPRREPAVTHAVPAPTLTPPPVAIATRTPATTPAKPKGAPSPVPEATPAAAASGFVQEGMASWYGPGFAGKLTANGERFDPGAMTCAHRKLKFGARVRVTNLGNGKSVVVRVNDRGPYAKQRVIDLSQEAARRLDMIQSGTARVRVEEVPGSLAKD